MNSTARGSSPGSQLLPKKNTKKAPNGSAHPQPPRPAVLVTSADGSAGAAGAATHGDYAHAHGKGDGADVIDAGLKSLHHYKRALPQWRYSLRQKMLPLVRWETPYLAWMQSKMRTPALDSYFAITANLGTHTFFMIGLPIMFWCGFKEFGQSLIHILGSGVFLTGFLKDMLSLPRPLSPPLHRITMSGSAALEYGFPSTHSANAVSVTVLAILMLHDPSNTLAPRTKLFLEGLSYFYAASIVLGRLYCGMHGFLDVIVGSAMGAAISCVEFYFGPVLTAYMHESTWRAPLVLALVIVVLVRIHPEPADDCPCFDDSVAFAGVMIGVDAGSWHYGRSAFAWPAAHPFPLADLGWPTVAARLVSGIFVIFAWREAMKPALLKALPSLFRAIEDRGLSLPRRFFMRASEYKNIPDLLRLRTDTVLPAISELPDIMRNIRRVGGRRGRSVSIGPQSAADAYETLAYRERRRRESIGSNASLGSKPSLRDLREEAASDGGDGAVAAYTSGRQQSPVPTSPTGHGHALRSGGTLAEYESMMGQGTVVLSPTADDGDDEPDMFVAHQDELGDMEMFERLVKPRVRYDVEVVTKLIVYCGKLLSILSILCSTSTAPRANRVLYVIAGIAWLSVEGIPLLFEFIGLGVEHLRPSR
ncbi:hypothetical protein RB601_008441 [Gaeumannomyces tritici]